MFIYRNFSDFLSLTYHQVLSIGDIDLPALDVEVFKGNPSRPGGPDFPAIGDTFID
jgi:hypothetical protein